MHIFTNIINTVELKPKHKDFIQTYYIDGRNTYKDYSATKPIAFRTFYRRKVECRNIINNYWQINEKNNLQQ